MSQLGFKAEKRREGNVGYTPGTYLAVIQSVESKQSKNGNTYIEVTFRGDGFGRIFLRMYDTAFGRSDLYDLLTAVAIDPSRDDIDTDEIVDKWVNITIEEGEPYNDKPTWDVVKVEEASSVEAEGEDGDDDDWE